MEKTKGLAVQNTEAKYKSSEYMKHFWLFLKPYKKPLSTVYFLFFLNSALNLLPALSIKYYIDHVLLANDAGVLWLKAGSTASERTIFSIIFMAVMAVIIFAANCVGVVMHRQATRSVELVIYSIKLRLQDHINKLSLSYFNSERVGDVLTKTVSDINNLSVMLRNSFHLVYVTIHFLLVPVIMIILSPLLFVAAMLPMPVLFYAFHSIRTKLKPLYRKQRIHQSQITSQLQETISGIKEIKAFSLEDHSSEIYREVNRQFFDIQNEIMRVFSFNHQLSYGIMDWGRMQIAVVGGICMFYTLGSVTIGTITLFLMLSNYLYGSISAIMNVFNLFQDGMVALERIVDFLKIVPDINDKTGAINLAKNAVKGNVRFRDVKFSYGSRELVLDGINLEVSVGEKIAVVGPTGSGKTTLLSLLPRFYDPQNGSIEIDGKDIREFTQTSLRQNIGIVFQETFLFYGTIRDNLLFANPDKNEDEIKNACIMANIYDTIMRFPDKFETVVGERGVRLSGGQKQRLAIARVILKDPAIVILDEATSSVDTVTEKLIQQSIDNMLKSRTAFIIAHRLSTIQKCDRIIVLYDKKIAETGNHQQLLDKRGIYYNMHSVYAS
jgi:ABC-type multidrug transport system fused ATPase/permease subunit